VQDLGHWQLYMYHRCSRLVVATVLITT
jgi:hypothetical protein